MYSLNLFSKLSFVFAFVFMSTGLSAQLETPRSSSSQGMSSQLNRSESNMLKLDEKKAKDLQEINSIYAERLAKLNQKSGGDNKTEVEALKRSHSQKIKSLLSSEQYRQYLEMKKAEAKMEEEEGNN